MGTINYTIPTAGSTLNSIADPQLATALQTLLTWANGNIDAVNVSAALAQAASVNQSGQTVKGATNIATSQSTSSASYTTLATPDQVTGITLPSNGLIAVWYQAAVSGTGSAAIFLGGNQVDLAGANAPAVQAATFNTTGALVPLTTSPVGLTMQAPGTGYSADVTTGQIVGGGAAGGPCYIFAAAGTYTVSIQFKFLSATVTAANRKLWVQALSFS